MPAEVPGDEGAKPAEVPGDEGAKPAEVPGGEGAKTIAGLRGMAVPAAIIAILLATAGFLFYIGFDDVRKSLTFTFRFTGAILLLTATFLIMASVAVGYHWGARERAKHAGLIVLLGGLTALAANTMLVLSTIGNDRTPYPFIWLALAGWSGWAIVVTLRTRIIIPAPRGVAFAVIATTALAVANFAYSRFYVPSTQQPKLIVAAIFEKPVSSAGKWATVHLNISLRNAGNLGVYLLGATYVVQAGSEEMVSPSPGTMRDDMANGLGFSNQRNMGVYETIQADELYPFAGWLESGQEINLSKEIIVAKTGYDKLRAAVSVQAARRDRLVVEAEIEKEYSWQKVQAGRSLGSVLVRGLSCSDPLINILQISDYLEMRTPIREGNAIARLTRHKRFAVVNWILHGAPYLEGTISDRNEEAEDPANRSMELYTRYGLVQLFSGWTELEL